MTKSKLPSAISADDVFAGSLMLAGPVEVLGVLRGSAVSTAIVTVGPGGRIEGDVEAPTVIIAGTVEGTVVADQLQIHGGGVLSGQATYSTLQIDRGGRLLGTVHRTAVLNEERAPRSTVPHPASPSPTVNGSAEGSRREGSRLNQPDAPPPAAPRVGASRGASSGT